MALKTVGTLFRQAGQAIEGFGALLQGSGRELGELIYFVGKQEACLGYLIVVLLYNTPTTHPMFQHCDTAVSL